MFSFSQHAWGMAGTWTQIHLVWMVRSSALLTICQVVGLWWRKLVWSSCQGQQWIQIARSKSLLLWLSTFLILSYFIGLDICLHNKITTTLKIMDVSVTPRSLLGPFVISSCLPSSLPPPPNPDSHWSDFRHYRLHCLFQNSIWMECTACNLLCLPSFTQHNTLKVHSSLCKYQSLIAVHC